MGVFQSKGQILPNNLTEIHRCNRDLSNIFFTHPTDQVAIHFTTGQGSILTWLRAEPLVLLLNFNFNPKRLSYLHELNVLLNTMGQFFG